MVTSTAHTTGSNAGDAPGCAVTVIATQKELGALEQEWNLLLEQGSASVFQSFEWVTSWWNHFREDRELHCLAFRNGDQLVGLSPLCRRTVRVGPLRVCTLLECIGRPHADYNDFLVLPGWERPVVRAFAAHVASGAAHADLVDLEEVPPDSCLKRLLAEEAEGHAMTPLFQAGPVCPYIPLPSSFNEFVASLGPNTRYNYRRKRAKLNETHVLRERLVRFSEDDIVGGVESFMRIHGSRWKGLGFPSAFDDPVHRSFFTDIAKRFAARDWLRLFFLEVDAVDVAASLDFAHRGRIYMYNSNAFGPPEVMRYSPGLLVKLTSIRHGISEHMSEYDMLRGDETYKYEHLKARERFNTTIRMAVPTRSGIFRLRLFLLWLFLRKAISRTRLEYYEWRRFNITRTPGTAAQMSYVRRRVGKVGHLATDFLKTYFGKDRSEPEP